MKTQKIDSKRIGNIEVRWSDANGKNEIVKWYKSEDREFCYVVAFLDNWKPGNVKIRKIGERVEELELTDLRNYQKIIEYINSFGLNMEELEGKKNDFLDDKLRWDLLPMKEIEDIVRVYHFGAKKYAPNSWQNLPDGFNRYRAAMMRHLMAYMNGERFDKESGLHHLSQMIWNGIAMLWYDKNGKGIFPCKCNGYQPEEKEIVQAQTSPVGQTDSSEPYVGEDSIVMTKEELEAFLEKAITEGVLEHIRGGEVRVNKDGSVEIPEAGDRDAVPPVDWTEVNERMIAR